MAKDTQDKQEVQEVQVDKPKLRMTGRNIEVNGNSLDRVQRKYQQYQEYLDSLEKN